MHSNPYPTYEPYKNKHIKICTLTWTNKLFGLGQIIQKKENRNKSAKKTKETKCVDLKNILDVNINEKLSNDIYSLLEDLQIKPTVNVTIIFLLYFNFKFNVIMQCYLIIRKTPGSCVKVKH